MRCPMMNHMLRLRGLIQFLHRSYWEFSMETTSKHDVYYHWGIQVLDQYMRSPKLGLRRGVLTQVLKQRQMKPAPPVFPAPQLETWSPPSSQVRSLERHMNPALPQLPAPQVGTSPSPPSSQLRSLLPMVPMGISHFINIIRRLRHCRPPPPLWDPRPSPLGKT